MGMTATEPPTFAELRQRILDGANVTEEEYARAKTLAELAELQAEADRQAAARQAEAERAARFADLRTKAQHISDQRDQRDALAEQVRQIVADMVRIQEDMEATKGAIIKGLLAEGIRAGSEDHGIGWANADAYTTADHVRFDGRRLALGHVRVSIQDAVGGALIDAGKQIGYLGSIVPSRPR